MISKFCQILILTYYKYSVHHHCYINKITIKKNIKRRKYSSLISTKQKSFDTQNCPKILLLRLNKLLPKRIIWGVIFFSAQGTALLHLSLKMKFFYN